MTDRTPTPIDIDGAALEEGMSVVAGTGRVYEVIGWAYATGEVARGYELRRRRGRWVRGSDLPALFHPEMSAAVDTDELLTHDRAALREVFRKRWSGSLRQRTLRGEVALKREHIEGLRERFDAEG